MRGRAGWRWVLCLFCPVSTRACLCLPVPACACLCLLGPSVAAVAGAKSVTAPLSLACFYAPCTALSLHGIGVSRVLQIAAAANRFRAGDRGGPTLTAAAVGEPAVRPKGAGGGLSARRAAQGGR
jgi:hypothetical protein